MSKDNKEKIGPVLASRFNQADFHRTIYNIKAEPGTQLSDIEDSEYYVHICAPMNQFDRIEIVEVSGKFWAEVLVTSAVKKDVNENAQDRPTVRIRVSVLQYKELISQSEAEAIDDISNYDTNFSEGNKWHVLRKRDNHIMAKGMDTEEDAIDWIITNVGKLTKKAA